MQEQLFRIFRVFVAPALIQWVIERVDEAKTKVDSEKKLDKEQKALVEEIVVQLGDDIKSKLVKPKKPAKP